MSGDGSPALEADLFRSVLRRQAATVTVVTTTASAPDGATTPVGFTATSFTSVSLRPPLVSFCVDRGSSSWPAVRRAGHLAVHLLAEDQAPLARVFATRGVDRFAGQTDWAPGPYGVPLLAGALAWLVCRTTRRVPVGDHVIVIAEPLVVGSASEGSPLLYHDGGYAAVRSGEARLRAAA